VLLSAWEYLTPLWVHTYTESHPLGEADIQPIYISTANPWEQSVWTYIDQGPVYLPDYRPAIRNTGLRLIPTGVFYRVMAPGTYQPTPDHPLDVWAGDQIHILGYDIPTTTVQAGQPLEIILYQQVETSTADIWMPYAELGSIEAHWTTDSRLLTPQWQPGEIVAERYHIPVPFTLPPGDYPLTLGYADLTGGQGEVLLSNGEPTIELAGITVRSNPVAPGSDVLEGVVANLDNQIAVQNAVLRSGFRIRLAPWDDPLTVRAGRALHLDLTWLALAEPRDSYTVFIHLIDGAGNMVAGHDYTPLGGACPTYLWFPKWLPGQALTDPYRLSVPADVPAGDYYLEVGMYGMTSLRRLSVVDLAGNLAGDRVILGPVRVE